jgi:hemolysin III
MPSLGEEAASAISHAAGAAASLAALPFLVRAAGAGGRAPWPFALFGLCLAALFASSAAYHAARDPEAKRRLRVLDHASIYVLIAGTYSAYAIGLIGGAAGAFLFCAEWLLAAAGVASCAAGGAGRAAARMERLRVVGALAYVAMGWLIAPFIGAAKAAMPGGSLALLVAGGLAYTVGVAFYAIKRVPYFHAVWHLFVLAGAGCHLASILVAAAAR